MTMKKRLMGNKKGFTLVELIVVLVILAILAALLIPALTGYIEKAEKKSIQSEARYALTAVQTEISDHYTNDEFTDTTEDMDLSGTLAANSDDKKMYEYIVADKLNDGFTLTNITAITIVGSKVTKLIYDDGSNSITYTAASGTGKWGAVGASTK